MSETAKRKKKKDTEDDSFFEELMEEDEEEDEEYESGGHTYSARPPKEEPTPFPAVKLFCPEVERVLDLFDEESPDEGELMDAFEILQDLHEYDRQWVEWPEHLEEIRHDPFQRGMFMLLRGLLRTVANSKEELQECAIDLLLSLITSPFSQTRVPTTFLLECGGVSILSKALEETGEPDLLRVLTPVTRFAPREALTTIFEGGALDVALDIIEDEQEYAPLEQKAALDFILSLSKRAPMQVVNGGAFDRVKIVSNFALIARRNKIMTLLRPIAEKEVELGTTNIRLYGLKS